jgi:hypothetical protein
MHSGHFKAARNAHGTVGEASAAAVGIFLAVEFTQPSYFVMIIHAQ